ncbi:hypothetical protein HK096_001258, partial [Nowakowskiella sp. JEL0078]
MPHQQDENINPEMQNYLHLQQNGLTQYLYLSEPGFLRNLYSPAQHQFQLPQAALLPQQNMLPGLAEYFPQGINSSNIVLGNHQYPQPAFLARLARKMSDSVKIT